MRRLSGLPDATRLRAAKSDWSEIEMSRGDRALTPKSPTYAGPLALDADPFTSQ